MPIFKQIIAKKLNYHFFQDINFGQAFLSKLNNYTCGVFNAKPREFYIRDFPETQIITLNPRIKRLRFNSMERIKNL